MSITGELLIGCRSVCGGNGTIHANNPATGIRLDPGFGGATTEQLDEACELAWQAFDVYRSMPLNSRASFIEKIAQYIIELGDELIVRCMEETGLSRARLESERSRTVGQLRMFADMVRSGDFLDVRVDPELTDRKPVPRLDIRSQQIPLGPVAVFGASNFPLAFSVAGGDTASALAAGCPVIVKSHSAHLGTSELVGRAIQKAADHCGLPNGVFSLLIDSGREISQGLVANKRIKAVGFTGSRIAGTAFMDIAAARKEPIPVYAEMSSLNPVLLFSGALEKRAEEIGKEYVASLVLGAGQFCTNPGLVIAIEGPGLDRFLAASSEALSEQPSSTMLTAGIYRSYQKSVSSVSASAEVKTHARGVEPSSLNQCRAILFSTTASAFQSNKLLQEEIFGAASLVVRCPNLKVMRELVESLEGQLTAAIHIDEKDYSDAKQIFPLLERKVGRVMVNGFGTGVEVCHAMVHGGPFPSSSDGRSTSVGGMAIGRFLRPVCYQNIPQELLPETLQNFNPLRLNRKFEGKTKLGC